MKQTPPKKIAGLISETCRLVFEKPLYSLGIGAYRAGVHLVSCRNHKAKLLTEGHRHIYETLDSKLHPGDRVIWIHAASLGEFEQGRPLMERIRREHPEYKILLTFFSPSGYEVRKDYNGADCVCYLPFDTPGAVRKFIDRVAPEMVFFVKYEFWRNYLEELHRRRIPTYLISGIFREGQVFFKKRGGWYAKWLTWFDRIYLQDHGSQRLLESIGIKDSVVAGDTRFDRVTDIMKSFRRIPVFERFAHRRPTPGDKGRQEDAPLVLMAGSSWPADEEVYAPWVNAHPGVKLVIAPHEFDDKRLDELKKLFANGAVLQSEAMENPEQTDHAQVIIIDCFGLLSSAYAYCDIAYVGGGFGAGLHNINEAAVYGVPVIYGPNNKKFIEAQELATLGGGLQVDSRQSFEHIVDRLLHDAADRERRGRWAAEYIHEKIGATDRIYHDIFDTSKSK